MSYELRDIDRVATPTIRGFAFQFVWTIKCWIALEENQKLVCEGAEDIDIIGAEDVEQNSLKHISKNMTENSVQVLDALVNFAAEYVWQIRRSRRVRFNFRTTAKLAEPKGAEMINMWLDGGSTTGWLLAQKILGYRRITRLGKASVCYLLREDKIDEFKNAIKWIFDDKEYESVTKEIIEIIRGSPRFYGVDPKDLFGRLMEKVQHVSSGDPEDIEFRTLTAFDLDIIMNDCLISKAVQDFASRQFENLAASSTHIKIVQEGAIAVFLAARYGDYPNATEQLSKHLLRAKSSPFGAEDERISAPLDKQMKEAIAKIDVDFYAVVASDAPKRKRDTIRMIRRLMWLVSAQARLESLTCDREVLPLIEKVKLPRSRRVAEVNVSESSDDPCHQVTSLIARAIALSDMKTLECVRRKVRLLEDRTTSCFHTQEFPWPGLRVH